MRRELVPTSTYQILSLNKLNLFLSIPCLLNSIYINVLENKEYTIVLDFIRVRTPAPVVNSWLFWYFGIVFIHFENDHSPVEVILNWRMLQLTISYLQLLSGLSKLWLIFIAKKFWTTPCFPKSILGHSMFKPDAIIRLTLFCRYCGLEDVNVSVIAVEFKKKNTKLLLIQFKSNQKWGRHVYGRGWSAWKWSTRG